MCELVWVREMTHVPRQYIFYAMNHADGYVHGISLFGRTRHHPLPHQHSRQTQDIVIQWQLRHFSREREGLVTIAERGIGKLTYNLRGNKQLVQSPLLHPQRRLSSCRARLR